MLIATAALANSSLPTLLVATKCDTPDDLRHPDLAGLAAAFPTCAGHFRTASNAAGSARECLHAISRAALANRRGGETWVRCSDETRANPKQTSPTDPVLGGALLPRRISMRRSTSSMVVQ